MEQTGELWGRIHRGVPENWPLDDQGTREAPARAASAAEGPLADMTQALLEAYGIPVVRVYQRDGAFARVLLGVSAYAAELYVPASRLEEAQELLRAVPETETPDPETDRS